MNTQDNSQCDHAQAVLHSDLTTNPKYHCPDCNQWFKRDPTKFPITPSPQSKGVEEAAKKHIEYMFEYDYKQYAYRGFKAGAEWQASNQSNVQRLLQLKDMQIEAFPKTLKDVMEMKVTPWIKVTPETMPENSKIVLGLQKFPSGKTAPCIVQYTKGYDIDVEDWDDVGDYNHKENDETHYLKEGWYEDCEQHQGMYDNIYIKRNIIAWMPLPKPPKQ